MGWDGVLPYIGKIGMCGPKGYGFSAVFVINGVSILAILVINWDGFCTLVPNWLCFLGEATFLSLLKRPSTIALPKALNIGLN